MTDAAMTLEVTRVRAEAKAVIAIELQRPDRANLPAFTAGAHLELHLPNGMIRQYSLCSDPAIRDRYVVAVGLPEQSRGGSAWIHESLRVGQKLLVKGPRNHFPLVAAARRHVFIGGGIGVTPMLAMIHEVRARGDEWELHYLVRNRLRAAFLEDLAPFAANLHLHCDDEAGCVCDVAAILHNVPADAAVYCCGPAPLMAAVELAGTGHAEGLLRFEYFAPRDDISELPADSFSLSLSRSGRQITVPAEQSILEALEDNGIEISWACREGICGSCEVKVLDGLPDHRDSFLSKAERDSNATIITCVSRALSPGLTIEA